MVYTIFGYRRKVVRKNIAMTLPHLSKKERLTIEKRFYHHLCDLFLEMIKTMTISRKEMEKRYVFSNLDVYLDLEKKGKSIALLCAHYASYEWTISMNYHITFEGYGIYKKINNIYFDKLVKDIRSKFKATLITTSETIPTLEKNININHLGVYGFASDQSPQATKAHHWGPFMGIETPVHTGAEMLAKRFNMNVIFLKTKKIKRGYYEATSLHDALPISPEFYLWTHKRWKHQKK
jgi:KDO2-lipid IV(A) lauroyltransferase